MKATKYNLFWVFFCLFFSINCLAQSNELNTTNTNDDDAILKKIDRIALNTKSILGVTAIHIETNKSISYNGQMPFFMASTIKVPIALTLLHLVDQNKASLNHVIQLNANHSVPGSGNLYRMLNRKKITMSLRQLLKLMIIISDNTASDAILHKINGPAAVQERLNGLGFNHIQVNHSILERLIESNGADEALLQQPHSSHSLEKEFNEIPMSEKISAWNAFENNLSDTTTSNDMAQLLVGLHKGEFLSQSSTNLLISIMHDCRTGKNRIKGLLPRHVKVAHKTGTWTVNSYFLKYPATNQLFRFASDVGIITLPRNKGHLVIAVYVKSTVPDDGERSRAIALVSRALYDYFMHEVKGAHFGNSSIHAKLSARRHLAKKKYNTLSKLG